MKVYRCCVEEGDHIGVAALDSRVLITVTEHGTGDGGEPATERELTADQADALADRLQAIHVDGGKSGDIYGVWIGEAAEDRGFLICLEATNGSSRSVILTGDDTAAFCAELHTTARAVENSVIPQPRDANAPDVEMMARRAAALCITAAVFDVVIDFFVAATWVAGQNVEPGPNLTEEPGE